MFHRKKKGREGHVACLGLIAWVAGSRYIEIFRATRPEYYNAAAAEMQRLPGIRPPPHAVPPAPAHSHHHVHHAPPVHTPYQAHAQPAYQQHHVAYGTTTQYGAPQYGATQQYAAPQQYAASQPYAAPQQYGAPAVHTDPSRPMPGVLRMRGLPYDVTIKDITDFFAGEALPIVPVSRDR